MKEKKLTIKHLPMIDIISVLMEYVNTRYKGNQTHCAQDLGISPSCINKILMERSDKVNKKIIEALNGYLSDIEVRASANQIKRNTLVYYTLE